MIEIPESIKDLFRQDRVTEETKKKLKLVFPEIGLTIENDRIESESMTITESLCESEDLEFGECNSSTFEITVADIPQDLTGYEFSSEITINGYEVPLGIYKVESFLRQADGRKKTITAYDRMKLFDTDVSDWYNSLSFPITIKDFRDSLCTYVGVGQEVAELPCDHISINKTIEPEEISGLEVLKSICQINSCFGRVSRGGILKYVFLQETGLYPDEELYPFENLYPSELGGGGKQFEGVRYYKETLYQDYAVEGITGVAIRQEDGDEGARVGESDNPYIVEGNFLVYGKNAEQLNEIAEIILNRIYGRPYRPASITCYGMPWIEPGDAIRIPTRDDVIETYVMKRTLSGLQALYDQIEATGQKKRTESFGIGKEIIQLEGRTSVITKNVDEVSVRLSDLKENTEAEFQITHNSILAEVKRASEAEGTLSGMISVEADRITSEVSRAKGAEGTLSSRISQTESSINLKVDKGDVSSEISVETDDITISGNRFSWSASNSSMTKTGVLTCNRGTFKGDVTADNFKVNQSIKFYLGSQEQYVDAIALDFYDRSANNTYYDLVVGVPEGTLINQFQLPDGTTSRSLVHGVSVPAGLSVNGDLTVFGNIFGLEGVKGIIIKGGSVVKTVSASTSIPMFSDSELSSMMGIYGISVSNTIVLFANGDGTPQTAHIDGSTHLGDRWYATTDRAMNVGPFRVNWIAIYFG